MLGLGSSLVSQSGAWEEIFSYDSDFTTSSLDGWEIFGETGEVTMTSNTDGFDGIDDWLKVEFDINQDGDPASGSGFLQGVGIRLDSSAYNLTTKEGDVAYMSFKMHLSEDWDGTDNVFSRYRVGIGNTGIHYITQDLTTNVPQTSYRTFNVTDDSTTPPEIYWANSGDLPQAGAIFHVKDIYIRIYRLFGIQS